MSAPCKVGDRIRLTGPVRDDYPPEGLPEGLEGTVDHVNTACGADIGWQVGVKWDNGRALMLLPGDRFEVLHPPPRLTREQIREIAVGVVEKRIFTASTLPEGENLSVHFLPLIAGWQGIDRQQVGNVTADMADAMEMGVNGYPCFTRCRIVHRADWVLIADLAMKADAAIKAAVEEDR